MTDENISTLKAHDYDKYLALFFAPADKKPQLAALFSFHYQISQIPVEVSEKMIGMIKFQWWRDCFEEIRDGKPPRPHPILKQLVHSNANLNRLEIIIDYYEKLLEDWQPRTLPELEDFITHTQTIIFEQAANILETTYSETTARAYSYNFMARKQKDRLRADMLLEKSRELWEPFPTVFAIITGYYNKNPNARRWKLLLKLAFSKTTALI